MSPLGVGAAGQVELDARTLIQRCVVCGYRAEDVTSVGIRARAWVVDGVWVGLQGTQRLDAWSSVYPSDWGGELILAGGIVGRRQRLRFGATAAYRAVQEDKFGGTMDEIHVTGLGGVAIHREVDLFASVGYVAVRGSCVTNGETTTAGVGAEIRRGGASLLPRVFFRRHGDTDERSFGAAMTLAVAVSRVTLFADFGWTRREDDYRGQEDILGAFGVGLVFDGADGPPRPRVMTPADPWPAPVSGCS